MSTTKQKIVVTQFPPALLAEIDLVAKFESRTRADLIREATRRYIDVFKRSTASTRLVLSNANGVQLGELVGISGGVERPSDTVQS
jgi:metal-responsive CopG/Arc/MetJ family transcriptional regulator